MTNRELELKLIETQGKLIDCQNKILEQAEKIRSLEARLWNRFGGYQPLMINGVPLPPPRSE